MFCFEKNNFYKKNKIYHTTFKIIYLLFGLYYKKEAKKQQNQYNY